jgi:hypothetical protein
MTVVKGFVKYFEGVVDVVAGVISSIKKIFEGDFEGAKDAFKQVIDGIKKIFEGLWDASMVNFVVSFVKGVVGYFKSLLKQVAGGDGVMAEFAKSVLAFFKDTLNKGIELLNKFIGWVNDKMSFTIPAFEIGGGEFFGKQVPSFELWGATPVTLFSLPSITQKFADGGFIEDGLFTMNQGEIAGRFNNGKSVVANNEQIIAGISEGVYQAVVSAMRGTSESGSQNVNVYLDGKQIYASIKKTESERGKQLFGNQMGYGY